MTRIVVLGGGFAGLETLRCLERGLSDRDGRSLTQIFPRDSAIMRPATRCPVCRHTAARTEREAA